MQVGDHKQEDPPQSLYTPQFMPQRKHTYQAQDKAISLARHSPRVLVYVSRGVWLASETQETYFHIIFNSYVDMIFWNPFPGTVDWIHKATWG